MDEQDNQFVSSAVTQETVTRLINIIVNYHTSMKDLALIKQAHELEIAARDKALLIQFNEYERRLNILNGEASRLQIMQATYLPREVWESKYKEIDKALDDLKSFRDSSLGRQALLAVIIPALISFVFLLVSNLIKK